jgi:hypothetical protein
MFSQTIVFFHETYFFLLFFYVYVLAAVVGYSWGEMMPTAAQP